MPLLPAGFWGFGVVLGFTLAFKAHLGLEGLWCGILTGVIVTGVRTLPTRETERLL